MADFFLFEKRNNSIEFFRFLFMIVICMWHFNMLEVFAHGYLAVEFFFVLSGFFIYKSYATHSDYGTLDFLLLKFKRFFPEFAVVLLITFLMKSPKYLSIANSFSENFSWVMNLFDDMLLVFSTGPFTNGVVNPTWYLSVLIWGGAWLYAMLRYNEKLSLSLIFPLLIIGFLGYIRGHGGNLELWFTDDKLFLPLIRGMAEMAIGVYLYIFLSEKIKVINMKYSVFFNALSVLSLVLFVMLLFVNMNLDIFSVLFIPFIIIGCFIDGSWFCDLFKNQIWEKLGGITYEMLLVHWPILMVFRVVINNFDIRNSILILSFEVFYLFLVLLAAVMLKWLYVNKLRKNFF